MAHVQLLSQVSGYGSRKHITGEILELPETHPLVGIGMAVVMGADAPVYRCEGCKYDPCAIFAMPEALEAHRQREGCGEAKEAVTEVKDAAGETSTCATCGTEFAQKHHLQRYCSPECRANRG